MKKYLTLLLVFLTSLTLASCVTPTESHDVFVTVYPMEYIAQQIFEGTDYTAGIVEGVTSHESSVDWSLKEIIAMTEAELLFYVGANYDQYIDNQINDVFVDTNVRLIKVEEETEYIQFIEGIVHTHDEDGEIHEEEADIGLDPHFWISPQKVKQVAQLMYDYMVVEFDDPDGIMEENFNNLMDDLELLSDDFNEVISNSTNAYVLTATNIYGYLKEDYGFNYLPISSGYHEEVEYFTIQEQEDLVFEAKEHNIQYIIYELYSSSPLSNSIFNALEEEGLEPVKLEYNILQSLSDEEISQGKDYISVMYDNLELLKTALGYVTE